MIRRHGGELGERPEELYPRPESHDVAGGAEEQPVGQHRRAAGHQPPQLPDLPAHQRCRLRRTPPAPPVARRAPPPLHVSGNSEQRQMKIVRARAATTCVVCVGEAEEMVE